MRKEEILGAEVMVMVATMEEMEMNQNLSRNQNQNLSRNQTQDL
jgi:hypothetical protein